MTGSSWSSRSMTCPRAPKARNGRPAERSAEVEWLSAALAEMEGAEAEHEKMAEQIAEVSARVESAERDAEQKAREIETLNVSPWQQPRSPALRSRANWPSAPRRANNAQLNLLARFNRSSSRRPLSTGLSLRYRAMCSSISTPPRFAPMRGKRSA